MGSELSETQLRILRNGETEPGGTGKWLYHFESGTYHCVACGALLFRSQAKYDSGTGWPSFTRAEQVDYQDDPICGMPRVEVVCAGCRGHLGHVFDDDDSPNGRRYCINSACLDFEKGA